MKIYHNIIIKLPPTTTKITYVRICFWKTIPTELQAD